MKNIHKQKEEIVDIASNWKALSGENNWKSLLDPIDDNLRGYLIHYGELVGAVGDALNSVKASKSHGLSRYPPDELFTEVSLQNSNNPSHYKVSKYFYLRSEVDFLGLTVHGESAWMGYVAVSTDDGSKTLGRRDILVCWRGTSKPIEWWNDFQFLLTSASSIFGKNNDPKVHYGFYDCYTAKDINSTYNKKSAREQVLAEVRKLVDKYANEEVSITVAGHSLGAALATLNAMDIVANGYNKPTGSATGFPVTCFAYASPRVGDKGLQKVFNRLSDLHLLRIRNARDGVPECPPKILLGYEDLGDELAIDCTKSPYLKNGSNAHDLNTYLHGIAGYQGRNKDFKLVIDLDIALINKYIDGLQEKFNIPPTWWVVKNRGMVQMDNGNWRLKDYVPDPPRDDDDIEEITPLKKKRKVCNDADVEPATN